MALFKVNRGPKANLPPTKTDGYAYFCTDDGSFWIDYKDGNGILQRKQIDAGTVSGHIVQIDVPADAKFTDTTYSVVTTSENGLMSYSDKTKLDGMVAITNEEKEKLAGIEVGANKTIVDSTLSATSTNPVQNKVVNTKFDTIQAEVDSKVDSIDGKGLSTEDYTTEEKTKLANLNSDNYVVKSGDTMTGALTMSGSSYIMTPTIFFSNDSSAPYEVGVSYSDTVKDDSNAVTAVILRLGCAYNDEPIILRNIANPISSSDVANKQYVDSRIIVSSTEPTGVSENVLWLDTSETSLVNADEVSY